MNITIITSSYRPNIGGVEEAVYNLTEEYKKLGHKVNIITAKWPENLKDREIIDEVEVGRFDFPIPGLSFSNIKSFVFRFPNANRKFKQFIEDKKPEAVHLHCVSSSGFYTLLAKKLLNFPLVVTLHGETVMDDYDIYKKSSTLRWTLRNLLKKADWVTANSSYILEDAFNTYFRRLNNSSVVFNGVDLDEFQNIDKYSHLKPYIFATGRIVYKKGFDLLIKAFKKVSDEFNDTDLLISGKGDYEDNLRNLISELSLNKRVHLLGPADRKKNVSLFKGCEFFVMPSRLEPFGIVCLEAMAAGKPVIASNIGGTKEFVTEDFGILVNPENINELADALRDLLSNKKKRERMGKIAKEKVKDFSWSNIAGQYLDIYRHSINARMP